MWTHPGKVRWVPSAWATRPQLDPGHPSEVGNEDERQSPGFRMSGVCPVRTTPYPLSPPGVYGKFLHAKWLPARFTRKNRVFNNLNPKIVKLGVY